MLKESARVFHQIVVPPEPLGLKHLDAEIESGVHAVVLQGVATGNLPHDDQFSYVPSIRKAVSRGIPVFVLRGVFNAHKIPLEKRHGRTSPFTTYEGEHAAILAGAIPLERADASLTLEVIDRIKEACSRRRSSEGIVRELCEKYNTPAFNERLRKLWGSPRW